jgi:hypothetical protein
MIKRDKRNIDKVVKVVNFHKDWDGRLGKVKDFRGDFDKGDPFVCVFMYDTSSVWPFPGHNLMVIGGPGTLAQVMREKMRDTTRSWRRWMENQSGKTSSEIDWATEPKIDEDLRTIVSLVKKGN